ncbi:MAG: hypothetical protein XD49_1584 [Caldanaerobacter subterraneus]|nr:MAG: hypothetical protein XD49_1584 [Caldanaerobacter subterraneus]
MDKNGTSQLPGFLVRVQAMYSSLRDSEKKNSRLYQRELSKYYEFDNYRISRKIGN